jgi:serine/threonine-protein kinase RsbW
MLLSPVKSEVHSKWQKVSFASTLCLCPILDDLLAMVPHKWQAEIRLGLQEALVNAAKHGNDLDPCKQVVVRFRFERDEYWWWISDQGRGFCPPQGCREEIAEDLPLAEAESGRGMSILHQIFDRVVWNRQGTQVKLCKQVSAEVDQQPLLE